MTTAEKSSLVSEHDEVVELLLAEAFAIPNTTWNKEQAERVFAHLDSCKECAVFYDEQIDARANECLRFLLVAAGNDPANPFK